DEGRAWFGDQRGGYGCGDPRHGSAAVRLNLSWNGLLIPLHDRLRDEPSTYHRNCEIRTSGGDVRWRETGNRGSRGILKRVAVVVASRQQADRGKGNTQRKPS